MISSLYIHVPFCLQKCDYCDFFSRPQAGKIPDAYVHALEKEIQWHAEKNNITEWKTIYLGGGTPGLLSPDQISHLLENLTPSISSATVEVTMEMNPESATKDKLLAAKKSGVTRLSLGIQSFNDSALKAVNRHCTASKARESLDLIKSMWDGQLNLDCIAGLPRQDQKDFLGSLREIISYDPDHISMYTLTVEEGTPLHKKIEDGLVSCSQDEADEQWMTGRDLLASEGYLQYEVSNFSKPGKESRHNMTYWRQQDYIGAGAGASGTLYGGKSIRWTNTRDIERYTGFWLNRNPLGAEEPPREVEEIDLETREFEFLMMGLRTLKGINSAEYKRLFSKVSPWKGDLSTRLGKDNGTWSQFSKEAMTSEKTEADGSTTYALNSKGILLLNKFLVELL